MGYSGSFNSTAIEGAPGKASRGTDHAYSVEARFNYPQPSVVFGTAFDKRWRRVPVEGAPHGEGIPKARHRGAGLAVSGLLTRTEAEALRWTFLCALDSQGVTGALCFETRIVEHEVKYEYEVTPVRYIDAADGRGELPDDMRPTEGNE